MNNRILDNLLMETMLIKKGILVGYRCGPRFGRFWDHDADNGVNYVHWVYTMHLCAWRCQGSECGRITSSCSGFPSQAKPRTHSYYTVQSGRVSSVLGGWLFGRQNRKSAVTSGTVGGHKSLTINTLSLLSLSSPHATPDTPHEYAVGLA